jgi:hypothetical protein
MVSQRNPLAVVVQDWVEPREDGSFVSDGFSMHANLADAAAYVASYWRTAAADRAALISRPHGAPYQAVTDEVTAQLVHSTAPGIRRFGPLNVDGDEILASLTDVSPALAKLVTSFADAAETDPSSWLQIERDIVVRVNGFLNFYLGAIDIDDERRVVLDIYDIDDRLVGHYVVPTGNLVFDANLRRLHTSATAARPLLVRDELVA